METIICATDCSPWSENAIKYAYELAQLMRARLILLYMAPVQAEPVLVLADGTGTSEISDADKAATQGLQLTELKKKLESSATGSPVAIQIVQLKQQNKENLQILVQQEKAGLVIIGFEDAGELEEVLSGAGAFKKSMQVPCPVLVVPRHAVFKPLWKIVYATDLKREPAADCVFLLKLAHLFNAEIILLHVLTNDLVGAREMAIEELQKVYRKMPYRNISFYIEASNSIEEGISAFVRANKADMLVLSNHSKKIWKHLLTQPLPHSPASQNRLPVLIRQQPGKAPYLCRIGCS